MKQLNALGGAPKGVNIIKINGVCKHDNPDGAGVTFIVKDEASATWIYSIFLLVELNYKTNHTGIANLYKQQLENKKAFIAQAISEENAYWFLLANIWLSEKENLVPTDDFNGLVFVSEKQFWQIFCTPPQHYRQNDLQSFCLNF